MYKVVEIFQSIDGEGCRAGELAQFVRLAGCNLSCSYCDTHYAWGKDIEYRNMTADDILNELRNDLLNITITGGEPLLAHNVKNLLHILISAGYQINVETNGAVEVEQFRVSDSDNLFFTVDYKLPSSGMEQLMIWNNFLNLRKYDVLKFVVGSDTDVERMIEVLTEMNLHSRTIPKIYIGTVWKKYDPRLIAERMLREPVLHNAVLQLQLHKFIWNPDTRGV